MLNPGSSILLVDDDKLFLERIVQSLSANGIKNVVTISDSRKVMPFLSENEVSVIFIDLAMPHISGGKLLDNIKLEHPHIPVIIMTGNNDLDTAVGCMKAGAFDFIIKPVNPDRLLSVIRKASEITNLRDELGKLKESLFKKELEHKTAFSEIITMNRQMLANFQYMEAIAGSTQPVLITGETGTGKELFAKAIHALSRPGKSFIAVNVAGLDDTMFSDTLFGHEKGAFTGADRKREGFVAKAAVGTLLLDEIGDLNQLSQVKLLRLLEERVYFPLGSDIQKKSEARIALSTNKDLSSMVKMGEFRKDLYYRLCTHRIDIPPLRERPEDIPLLANHFINTAATAIGKSIPTQRAEFFTPLSTYNFPGNVRELKSMVYDAVSQHRSGPLSIEAFAGTVRQQHRNSSDHKKDTFKWASSKFPTLRESEDYLVSEAIRLSKGNMTKAASLLGITRQGLYNKTKTKP